MDQFVEADVNIDISEQRSPTGFHEVLQPSEVPPAAPDFNRLSLDFTSPLHGHLDHQNTALTHVAPIT